MNSPTSNVRPIPPGDHPAPASPQLALSWRNLLVPAVLGLLLLWAFAPTFAEMAKRWSDPEYSHGYLVPGFALVLLWLRRDRSTAKPRAEKPPAEGVQPSGQEKKEGIHAARTPGPRPTLVSGCCWWGLLVLGLGVFVRFAADYLYMDWLDAASLLPCVAGLTLLLGGTAALRWAWPSIAFLVFMIPLPYSLEVGLANPLQRVATRASTYCLQTLGLPALSEGNIILINDTRMGVERACSGLSMLVIFFALSTAFAFVVTRTLWQKLVLVVSAVPIALISNITRITVTGIMHETVGHKAADLVFHDLAGWLMMPFALILLWLELAAMARLIVEVQATERTPFSGKGASPRPPSSKAAKRRRAQKTYVPPTAPGPRQV